MLHLSEESQSKFSDKTGVEIETIAYREHLIGDRSITMNQRRIT